MSSRNYGMNPGDSLYNQHEKLQRKKEQLVEEVMKEQYKECTFRPQTTSEFER